MKRKIIAPIIGTIFGLRTVIDDTIHIYGKRKAVTCRCICGKIDKIEIKKLINGGSSSCITCAKNKNHQAKLGDVFGSRTIINTTPQVRSAGNAFLTRCICGKESYILYIDLRKGRSGQCLQCSAKIFYKNFQEEFYIGKVIGKRTIIDNSEDIFKGNQRLVKVRCVCGKEELVQCQALRRGRSDACERCKNSYTTDQLILNTWYVGMVFGTRKVIDLTPLFLGSKSTRNVSTECLRCGNILPTRYIHLITNAIKYCVNCKTSHNAGKKKEIIIQPSQEIILENNQSIDAIFNSLINNNQKENQSETHIQEQEKLKVLHSLNKDNIDNVFDEIINMKDQTK